MSDDKKQKGLMKSLSELSFVKKLKSIKHIEIIIVVIFALILLLICFSGNSVFGFLSTKSESTSASSQTISYVSTSKYADELEVKLKSIISNIKDAGTVEVMVSLEGSAELSFASDKVITTSAQSTTTETKVILVNSNGTNMPIVVNEKLPKVNGVVVVSSGAKDVNVKLNILSAVQTILNVQADKILVLSGN
ncbi:MAG: hypothetical protein KBT30_01675 [Clostridiales bacterium]|nr:hypothetical protein [Candidatus Apopatousia equi]